MEANAPEVRRLTVAVTALVADASRGMSRQFDVNRVSLLTLVVDRPGITPSEAAQRLRLPPSSVTRHAQALEAAGHLVLRRNKQDGRSAVLEATEAGVAELAGIRQVATEVFSSVLDDWSAEEVERLAELLERFAASWQKYGESTLRGRRRVSRWQHDITPDTEEQK